MATADKPSPWTFREARWHRLIGRLAALLVLLVLVGALVRSGQGAIGRSEALALDLAERNLRHLVLLKAQRTVAEHGVDALPALAGQDPRTWAEAEVIDSPELAAARPRPTRLHVQLEQRWQFDAGRGELVYRSPWMAEGERRWRVELVVDDVDSPTPGLARDLQLVRVDAFTRIDGHRVPP